MEVEKDVYILSKDEIITGISIPGKNEQELLASFEYFMKKGHTFPMKLPNTETPVKDTTIQEGYTTLTSPIPSLTPLETSFELPSSEFINIDDLTPITLEEIPPSNFFFNKKRKAIIIKEAR